MWAIPLSDRCSDQVDQVVDEDDTAALYRFYDAYVERIKHEAKRNRR